MIDEAHAGHRALRRGRVSIPHQIYHLTIVTEGRTPLFARWAHGRVVARALNAQRVIGDARTLAWALMPDHLHWLLALGDSLPLRRVVQRFKSVTTLQLNRALDRDGAIWAHAYHDRALRKDEDVRSVARYVVGNPLKDGLVTDLGQYPLWDAIWIGSTDPL
jgi:putative transposase